MQFDKVSPDEINPVDYFNRNFVQYTFEVLEKLPNVKRTGHNSLTYITNSSDAKKRMIVVNDDGTFEATMKNGMNLVVGEKYTAFMMLQKFAFKGNFGATLHHVTVECMMNKSDYIRVGIKYLRKIHKFDRYGVKRNELKVWDYTNIARDHGKDAANSVEKFMDFTLVPDNMNYESQIDNNYNLYAPFEHKPCDKKEYKGEHQFKWIKKLLQHIFGSEEDLYEKGTRYMKVLYEYPRQAMPIVVLTSKERQTGKSTFIDFLNILFGDNTVIINPEDISNSFNEPYATKNIIMIEESRFESVQATEKLKNLATQKKISVNAKFIQQYSLPFFGKIIITSNDEDKFSKVDPEEIRYWILKVPSLKGKEENHNILEDMTNEIPYFLYWLKNIRPKPDLTKSRMVFTPDELINDALLKVKKESRPELMKEIEIYMEHHCMQNTNEEVFFFTPKDIKERFFRNNDRATSSYINKLIKEFMDVIKHDKIKRYIPLKEQDNMSAISTTGRPYEYKNPYFGQEIDGDDLKIPDDLPY